MSGVSQPMRPVAVLIFTVLRQGVGTSMVQDLRVSFTVRCFLKCRIGNRCVESL